MQRKKTWGKVDICFACFAHNENRDDDREAVHQMKIVELICAFLIVFSFFLFLRTYILILVIYDIINVHSCMRGGQWLLP